jgi:dTDP-4-amino-4,6-dideoxygalactose transaminase
MPCSNKNYLEIMRHYDACLQQHGDTARGADWPNETDRQTRFSVMLGLLQAETDDRVDLLDFACGTGELLRHVDRLGRPSVSYKGVDISRSALEFARTKFPGTEFTALDILQATDQEVARLSCDYCIINGLFTIKRGLSDDEMWDFTTRVIRRLWPITRKAIAFNVMSKQVEYERADLFHVSLDRMAGFLHELAGRSVTFRADYGLFEYTCYVRREPRAGTMAYPTASPPKADASMVCRPRLPTARQIAPYLEEIDRRRWYSNFGTAVSRLADRLAGHFGLESGQCVTAASGTDALTAALIGTAGRARADRPYCLMPSYTFVATAAAALNAGYQPYFVDIDSDSLAVQPERLLDHPMLPQAGAVIVVGPYGQPVPHGDWQEFARLSGIPVVIDAAAGFDAIAADPEKTLGDWPVMLSLHATKVFGVGEGGLILCRDAALVLRCGRALNFGFLDSREALVAGFNGKMSEYHAAVGLAALDAWPQMRAGFLAAAQTYRRAAQRTGLGDRIIAETAWASNYVLYRAETAAEAAAAQTSLAQAHIDFRLWYGLGCHAHPAYAAFPRDPLPVTQEIAPRIIGLPVAVDLAEEAIEDTVAALAGG